MYKQIVLAHNTSDLSVVEKKKGWIMVTTEDGRREGKDHQVSKSEN